MLINAERLISGLSEQREQFLFPAIPKNTTKLKEKKE